MLPKIGRNDPCWCGSGKKYKTCHEPFDAKIKKYKMMGAHVPDHSIIKTPEQIEMIKKSCKVNVQVLDTLDKEVCEGMELSKIDDIVNEVTYAAGAIPAPLNYEGYPYSVCTSVNDQVCHGYPHKGVYLKNGDIVNCDCSTILNGYFSDSSRMYCIGDVGEEKKRLVDTTKEAIYAGLEKVQPWGFLGDVSQAVHDYCYDRGYTVVREIGGHGVGLEFHEDPWCGYFSKAGTDMLLVPGMMFTIEPMVNMGKEKIFTNKENGWEVYTADHMPSAQWEIMVLVTEDGHEVLSW
ncbi:MAG: methionyl aminopeptidase [Lachnospiraceae bacterium]|nr:methionyl aminopeptidase [Lachnospiraceae bacterium]